MALHPSPRRIGLGVPDARLAGLLGLFLLNAACTGGSDARDLDIEEWTVATEPATTVGAMAGDSAYLFQRVVGAELLDDGRIAVADAGLSVVRVFDADGRFLAQMGGRGRGPGELMEIAALWTVADTLATWDSGTLRVTYFRPDGGLVRTVSLESSTEASGVGRLDLVIGPLEDGTVALGSLTAGSPEGLGRDRISVERFGPEGNHLGRIMEVTGFIRGEGGPGPFTPYPYFATHDDAVYFTNGESPEVRVWRGSTSEGPAGSAAEGPAVLALPPAGNDAEAAWDALPALLDERGNTFGLRFLGQAEPSDSIPHLAGLVVDAAGRAWTKAYDAPLDGIWLDGGARVRGGSWWVVDPDEGLVARAKLPDGLILMGVSGDDVLGLTVDELGVERVQLHRLQRRATGPA